MPTWDDPPQEQTAILNASYDPMDGHGFAVALVIVGVFLILGGLYLIGAFAAVL